MIPPYTSVSLPLLHGGHKAKVPNSCGTRSMFYLFTFSHDTMQLMICTQQELSRQKDIVYPASEPGNIERSGQGVVKQIQVLDALAA
jgi:hypothetical protein